MGTFPGQDIARGSVAALLAESAPRLRSDRSFVPQLDEAMAGHHPELSEAVAARVTSEPGQFNRNMRRLIYRRLGLSQPVPIPAVTPPGMPTIIERGD
jgi:hypothetical protein